MISSPIPKRCNVFTEPASIFQDATAPLLSTTSIVKRICGFRQNTAVISPSNSTSWLIS